MSVRCVTKNGSLLKLKRYQDLEMPMVMQMKAKIKIMEKKKKNKRSSHLLKKKKYQIKQYTRAECTKYKWNFISRKKTTKILFLFFTRKLFVYSHTLYCYNNFGLQSPYISGFYFYIIFSYSLNFQHLFVFFFENFYSGIPIKNRVPISFFFHFFFF